MERLTRRVEGMKENLAIYKNEKKKLEAKLSELGVEKVSGKNIDKLVKEVKKDLKTLQSERDDLEENLEEALGEYEDDES